MTAPRIPHMPRPCDGDDDSGPCPWRLDAEPGEFSAARFEQLAGTVGTPEHDAPVTANLFACHSTGKGGTVESADVACAGALRVAGGQHVRVRLLLATGQLPRDVIGRRDDEPELFDDYDTMATQQADGMYRPEAANVWRAYAGFGPLAGYGPLGGSEGFAPLRRDSGSCALVDVETRGSGGPDSERTLS